MTALTQFDNGLKLGKTPARPDAVKLKAAAYLTPQELPVAPPDFGHENLVQSWPVLANDLYGDCVHPDTRVQMADGTTRAIKDLKPLDLVLTHTGTVAPVNATRAKPWCDDLIKIGLYGNNLLHVTRDHKMLTRRGWVRAGQLELGDWLFEPRPVVAKGPQYLDTRKYIPDTLHLVRGASRSGIPASARPEFAPPIDKIELTPGFGYLIGLFLAEGSTNQSTVRWTFGAHERDTLVADCISELAGLGLVVNVKERPAHHSITVTLCGKFWRYLFAALCGRGASGKRLHPDLHAGPDDFLQRVFDGWMNGDGHHRRGERSGSSASHQLALDMRRIALTLGMAPGIRKEHVKVRPPTKTTQPRYVVTVRDAENHSSQSMALRQAQQDGVWRRVRSLGAQHYVGYVFDIEVAGDHTFVAEGIAVHNCVFAGALHQIQLYNRERGKTVTPTDLDALHNYSQVTGFDPNDPSTDQGADMEQAAKYWRQTGMLAAHARRKIAAYAALDLGNIDQIRLACFLFGAVGIGIEFPAFAMDQFNAGQDWDVSSYNTKIEGGHYIPMVASRQGDLYVVTWGRLIRMTPAFYRKYADEVIVHFSHEMLVRGKSLDGFNTAALEDDLRQVTHA